MRAGPVTSWWGFAPFGATVVGILANQSLVRAGRWTSTLPTKAPDSSRFCNAFNIPLVTLVDVPGFLPGIEQSAAASPWRQDALPRIGHRAPRSPSSCARLMAVPT